MFQVGVLNATRYAPVVVLSLFAGVWLDTRRRRPILIACSLGCAILVGLVPISYALGLLSIGLLYVVSILVGSLSVIFDYTFLQPPRVRALADLIAEAVGSKAESQPV